MSLRGGNLASASEPLVRGRPISRRRFLRQASAGLSPVAAYVSLEAADPGETLRFGLVTDVHYADADPRGNRCYRDSLAKLERAIATFNTLDLSFVVELGDFIDSGKNKGRRTEPSSHH